MSEVGLPESEAQRSFLVSICGFWGRLPACCTASNLGHCQHRQANCQGRSRSIVSLDGTETKSEDRQWDA